MSTPAPLPTTLEEMAAQYVEQIRRAHPTGPYHLLGWSLGGLTAHAVACQLQQQGAEVALLALLDAYPLSQHKFLEFPPMQQILSGLMKDLGRDPGDNPLDVATVMEFLRRDGAALSILQEHHIWAMYEIAKNNHLLASRFVPARFEGDLLLVTATADRSGEEPPPESWLPHIGGEVRIREVHCRHQLMMEPASLAKIGSILCAELERARGSLPAGTGASRDAPIRASQLDVPGAAGDLTQ
jgi:thioesterase domain-containing protein